VFSVGAVEVAACTGSNLHCTYGKVEGLPGRKVDA